MKVIVGVDDSPHSGCALDYVLGATWPKNAKFLVLSAAAPIFVAPGDVSASDAIGRLMEEQAKYHREIAKLAAGRLSDAGLQAEARSVIADPRAAILELARVERVNLIVVGSHGRTGIRKLLLGSVASHVVEHAPCSVLVVRKEEHHG